MKREPLVYEGRIRIFDPEPGDVVYLIDADPNEDDGWGPNLTHIIEDWLDQGLLCAGPPVGPFRITIEEA